MSIYSRAALLGLATGGRSTVGVAALAATARTAPRWLTPVGGLASAIEFTGDKLPKTPSRLAPIGLAARLAGGVACGVLVARRERAGLPAMAVAALLGVAGAAAGALLGSRWRSLAGRRLGVDWPGAVLEDAGWLAVAGYAVKP